MWRRSIMALLLVAAVATAAFRLPAADLEAPTAQDRQVTLMVRRLMRDEHLSQRKLDDEVSQRAFKSFLKSLDPLKVYFYQKDVDEFAKQSRDLDERVREGNIKFAYTVFRRFLQRVDERVVAIDDLLKSDFDFTIDESLVVDGDTASYPKDAAEARDRWRKRLKFDLLVLETEETEGDEARAKLRRRYSNFAKRMRQTDSDELLEMYLTAVTTSYDPHSTYMSASSLENFRILMRLNLEGIGAALRIDDGYTVVSQVIPGGAADKQGELKPADRIVSVAQGEGEMVDVVDLKLDDVVKLIRGKAGTIVKLGVIPAGGGEKKTISITRAKIELKDSEARGEVLETGKKPNGNPYRIGVINLPSFYMDMEAARLNKKDYKSTTRDVRNILAGFKEEGVDAVLLDLRRNGGGSLSEAISLTGLFVEDGTIVQVKDPDGTVHQFKDDVPGMVWDGPLVVATSKFSASASEILAGAIQDYRRGLVVGDTS
ncbi:MAG: S41 family peptidase, partial [Pirellulaceae bacterium]|nr:S41 family peptidase [Pirellulaceae bacterium]